MNIKKLSFCALSLLALGFMFPAQGFAAVDPSSVPLDSIVALVNDDVITQSELDKQVNVVKAQLAQANTPAPSPDKLEYQVLNKMVNEKLELQMATKLGIDVSQDTVNKAIAHIAERNNITLEKLKETVVAPGLSYSIYQNEIKDELTIQELLQREIAPRITISKKDVDNVMSSNGYAIQEAKHAKYHVQDILVSLPDNPTPADLEKANKQAQDILAKLSKGANFNQVAVEESNGQQALNGGDLGWRQAEELPSMFADKVENMKEGEVAGPIRTGNGLHIIKLAGLQSDGASASNVTETHVRHILIKTDVLNTDKTVEAELDKLRDQINHGVDFAGLAEKYSQDPGSATKGGDLGWVHPGMLVPPFEKAMNKLKIDEVSEPVKTEYGWHIIQVEARRQVDDSKEQQINQVRQMLYERKFDEQTQEWLRRMRHASYVKILIPKPTSLSGESEESTT